MQNPGGILYSNADMMLHSDDNEKRKLCRESKNAALMRPSNQALCSCWQQLEKKTVMQRNPFNEGLIKQVTAQWLLKNHKVAGLNQDDTSSFSATLSSVCLHN